MRKKLFASLIMAAGFFGEANAQQPAIIPQPRELKQKDGHFVFSNQTWMAQLPSGKGWWDAAEPLREKLSAASGVYLAEHPVPDGATIRITKDPGISAEGYDLDIKPRSMVIKASTPQGAFYAVQTILQLLPAAIENRKKQTGINLSIPCLSIKDKPAFAHRGVMIDVARHFMLAGDMKKLIDGLAMQKINTLHWHLSDDQGWRFESKKYPKLTETGAFRKGDPHRYTYDYASRPREETYGGFYTQTQMREIVAYAQKKFINIIPEIDVPAHSAAAMASYPELRCVDSAGNQKKEYDFGDGSLCTRDANFKFLFGILDELMSIFPSQYIHLGGDEAFKKNWKGCADCNRQIKEKGLKDYDELQSFFVKRISSYLVSKGRKPIGWDEIIEGGLAPNAIVMSWRGEKGGIEAVKQGHQAIMSPVSHCYYDYYLSREDDEPVAWGGYIPLEKVYSYKPVPEGLTDAQAKLIMGAQGNLWTEHVPDFVQASYMIFPRISALSEVLWTNPAQRDYHNFVTRLENISPRFTLMGIYASQHRYEVSFKTEKTANGVVATVHGPSGAIHYTTDGDMPTKQSPVYNGGINVNKTSKLTAAIFNSNGEVTDKANVQFSKHKGLDAVFEQLVPPSKYYSSGGNNASANGLSGTGRGFKDNEWLGWNGDSFTGLYKFDKPTEVNSISTRFYHEQKSWVWYPKVVEVLVSNDGVNFMSAVKKELATPVLTGPVPFKIELDKLNTRYLKIIATPLQVIPSGYPGAGSKSWIMVDEIIID